jgi:putative oxidoreductase
MAPITQSSPVIQGVLILVGRSLLGLYFLLPGVAKFLDWDRHIALMDTHQMPLIPALLATAGVFQIIGGICLLVNRQVLIAALGLAAMVLLINVNLHDFWNVYEGVNPEREAQNFVKNLGIFAGLLLLAAMAQDTTKSP